MPKTGMFRNAVPYGFRLGYLRPFVDFPSTFLKSPPPMVPTIVARIAIGNTIIKRRKMN